MTRAFTLFAVCEILYVLGIRVLLHAFPGSMVQLELYWSALRLVSIGALLVLFRAFAAAHPYPTDGVSPRLLVAAGMFLAPVLTGNMDLSGPARYVFAATSILVGLREELAYRGILQPFLASRYGLMGSLILSNLAFVAYHFGVQPFMLHYVLQIFLCGTILGIVYHLSGSIVFVAALHAVYDGIDCFSPYFAPRLPDYLCTVVLTATLAALLLLTRKMPGWRAVPGKSA